MLNLYFAFSGFSRLARSAIQGSAGRIVWFIAGGKYLNSFSRTAWAFTLCSDRDWGLTLQCGYSSLFGEKYMMLWHTMALLAYLLRYGVAVRLFFFIRREVYDVMTHDGPFSLLYPLLPPFRKEIMLLPCCLSGPADRSYPNMMWAFGFGSHPSDVTVYYSQ